MNLPYLTDYIYVARGFLDDEICQKIISENQKLDDTWSQHSWTTTDVETGKLKQHSRDEAELSVKGVDEETAQILIDAINNAIISYHNKIGVTGMVYSHMSHPRINRYTPGSNMAKHNDAISSLFEKGVGRPTLSIVGVLNDNYFGGEFIMFDNMKIQVRAGDILIFPATFMYTHEVTTVTEGERWSFVSWAF
jgi:predicted 2-oxoglutarate/Fe(II)-dependent dioxygenase YbiX